MGGNMCTFIRFDFCWTVLLAELDSPKIIKTYAWRQFCTTKIEILVMFYMKVNMTIQALDHESQIRGILLNKTNFYWRKWKYPGFNVSACKD